MADEREASRLAPEKHERILHAALDAFTELGYERACVDAIAGRASVSKATVYNHFADKKALFSCCLFAHADDVQAALEHELPPSSLDLEAALAALGEGVMRVMLSPTVAALHKVIAAEVSRFPELGRALFDRCITQFRGVMARFFVERGERGELEVTDPGVAAMQFLALCSSDLKIRIELGLQQGVTDEEVRLAVREAVRVFLRAYRPSPPGR